jgi:Uma2 family endonuclease
MDKVVAPSHPHEDENEREGMSLEDFLEAGSRERFELINGRKIPKMPDMYEPQWVTNLLCDWLKAYVNQRQLGTAFMEMTFIMPGTELDNWVKGSRIPDISFYAGDRITQYRANRRDSTPRPLSLVPDFVIEIVSPNDRYTDIDEKIDAYLEDGVRLIWLIDPQRRKATIYAPDLENPIVLKGDATLDAGDVIPGFTLNLPHLFAQI